MVVIFTISVGSQTILLIVVRMARDLLVGVNMLYVIHGGFRRRGTL